MKRYLIAVVILFLSLDVIAQEAENREEDKLEGVELPMIVITPTRYETPLEDIPSSLTVISEEEIISKGKPQVKDILADVPGLNIVQTGGLGSSTSIFMRGTESSHTLVMVDGIKVYDPMSTNASFNFANLTLDNVDRVEVLRGSYSTLYGSDAIGGVINVITKKGAGKPKAWVSSEMGSFLTFKESIGSDGEINKIRYSAAFSRLDTEGISKADRKYDNDEKDGYRNTSFSTRIDYEPHENITIGSTFRYTGAEIEIDDAGGYNGDDPNRKNIEKQTAVSSYMDLDLTDWWSVNLKWLWMENKRNDKDYRDDIDTDEYLYSEYKGWNTSYEFQNIMKLGSYGTVSGGIDYDRQAGDSFLHSYSNGFTFISDPSRVKNHNIGYYLQGKTDIDEKFHAIAGFRLDDHSEFGTHDTYAISGKYIFDTETNVKGAWSTGFKAPSLYQLYDPANGNAGLRPEESQTYEAGIGQDLFEDRIKLESTFFYTKLDDLIDWVLTNPFWFTGQYENANEAKIWGAENMVALKPIDNLGINYTYTYMKTQNEKTHQSLDRRPRNKHVLSVIYAPVDKVDLNLTCLYVGDRKDRRWIGGNQTQIILKSYYKIDLSGRYTVNKYLELFARIENLLDKHYQEVDGYGVPGIAFYGGGKVTF